MVCVKNSGRKHVKVARCVSLFALVMLGLVGCQPCAHEECSVALTSGPGDSSYIPNALAASADQFFATRPQTGGATGPAKTGSGFSRLQLDRDTLSPDSSTAFSVARNLGLGLRAEARKPFSTNTQVFAALSGNRILHNYNLPQGLGPLSDPTRINFASNRIGAEVGLLYERALPTRAEVTWHMSLAGGYDLVQTHTTIRSALLSIDNTSFEVRSHATLGTGIAWQPDSVAPQIELRGEVRLLDRGQMTLRNELRLTY